MANPTVDDQRALLREKGLRATSSRIAVLEALQKNRGAQPVSHGDLVEKLAAGPWDPATIYRNLMDLVEVGLVRRSDLGDHVWRFDLVDSEHDAKGHPHFVCTECGVVECLPEMVIDQPRAKAPRSVRQKQVEVQVRGLCDGCD